MVMGASSPEKPLVMIVDDTPENLTVLGELLKDDYRVRAANGGANALRLAHMTPVPDLILLDAMMPDMDGFEVLKALKLSPATQDIPVLFVTVLDNTEAEERGLALGAVDYITKPIRPNVVLARVRTHLELKRYRDRLRNQNAVLEAEVARRMDENMLIQDVTIRALARLAETRDPETGNHLLRTQGYMHALAVRLRHHPRFAHFLDDHTIKLLVKSAPLHDIGKVGIPDDVLLKPGKLTPEELTIMRSHALIGANALERAERDVSQPIEFLTFAKQIARNHHERWDGNGYPDGLAGDAIPIAARIMAIADVFDALISQRPYKPPMPLERARAIMAELRGTHFDPDMLDSFLEGFEEFSAIAERHTY